MEEALANPEIKALVNSRDQDGGTILFTAATKGSPEIVKLLLDAGTAHSHRHHNHHTIPLLIAPALLLIIMMHMHRCRVECA